MTSRFRLALVVVGALGLAGCSDVDNAGAIYYTESERLATDLKDKPELQKAIRAALADQFGPNPQQIKVPAGSGLPDGGVHLADYRRVGEGDAAVDKPIAYIKPDTGEKVYQEGGYSLYRKHCLHCHGVSGAGDGPTAPFLYPKPRDYRKGLFKFTSTPQGVKPTRDDLRRTIRNGLIGSSMPAFEALMSDPEIEQVVDYMTFLSMRGEVESALIEEASGADDKDAAKAIGAETVNDIVSGVFAKWKAAETQAVNPPVARVASTHESIERGRELFLGVNKTGNKVECAGCHGPQAKGNGASFIEERVFQDVVFRYYPVDVAIARLYESNKEKAAAATSHGDGHGSGHAEAPAPVHSSPAEVAKFLRDNADLATYFRKNRKLLEDEDDKTFAATLADEKKAETVASAALALNPELADPEFRSFFRSKYDLWVKGSLDDWGNPIRPANLNKGDYKGGRRPLDLYWRLSKGINGAKMPAHVPTLPPEQIWDLVNFVLELPHKPSLLPETLAPAIPPASHGVTVLDRVNLEQHAAR